MVALQQGASRKSRGHGGDGRGDGKMEMVTDPAPVEVEKDVRC